VVTSACWIFPTAALDPQSTDCVTGTEPESAVDLELVRLAQQGDRDAFGRLVERNRASVFRAAYAALGSASEADDVAQDAFISAYRKLGSFRGQSSFKTWLLSIAWRKALDRRKKLTRWMRMTVAHDESFEGSADVLERLPSMRPSHDERVAADELYRVLKRLIASLPRKLRDVLLLAGSGEYSYDEIAAMLGVPVGTVKWRVSEARRMLKQKLAVRGFSA
jgi:RNA polymerase sigma-70 factor (ECF subfamily)